MKERMKWEYTTDKKIATLMNPNDSVLSATIIYTETVFVIMKNFMYT